MLENARRRWPAVRFEVAYAAMQGTRAAAEVIEAVDRLDRNAEVDVIVVARGGGSVEDLLPFSDEALIRAVHQARTPVVSAIGHEPDQPLLDLVADVRASTPDRRRQAGRPRRRRGAARRRPRRATGSAPRWPAASPASRPGSTRCGRRPALADPRSLVDARRRRGRPAARPRPPQPAARPRPGHRRPRPPARPRPRAVPAGHPAARVRRAPGRRRPRAQLGRRRRGRRRRHASGSPTAAIHATTTRVEPDPAEESR